MDQWLQIPRGLAKDPQAYDNSTFLVDWENEVVTCPEGKMSKKWTIKQKKNGQEEICACFGELDCRACPARVLCTHSAVHPRKIVLRPKEQHEAIQAARNRQNTKEFQERYAKRSGIEGTISTSEYGLLIFVFLAILACRKHIFNIF